MPIDDLTREFLIESQEGLDRMEQCLTDLETRPGDVSLLAEVFRSVHTIKGTTGFLGFRRLEKLAHAGESLLGLLRDAKLDASPPVITALLQLLDGLRAILRTIETEGCEGDFVDADLIARLKHMESAPVDLPSSGANLDAPVASRHDSVRNPSQDPASPAPLREMPVQTDSSGMTTLQRPATEEGFESIPAVSAAAGSTLRVDVDLLNRMMNLVGELVLTRNQILQTTSGDGRMTMLSRRLDMVTADLRESVMKARMQPVSNIFSKIPRLVRDLSHDLHRQVQLKMDGQDTELDKSLLEGIKDPLTHAVRNALDHGIEPPEVRAAAGKPTAGTLRLRAMQEGSHVLVEVSDDGAGIPVEKVRAKAIDRGLVSAEHAAQMGERELLQFIFQPGFSTAAEVTKVSGRGVGMDVVRTNVEKIGGKVEIDSRTGRGTTLRMRIPLTLAIIPALIVRSAQHSFALPQSALSELVYVAAEDNSSTIEWIGDAPIYRLRGKLLPLVFLDRLLALSDIAHSSSAEEKFIAVLDADGRQFGLVIDGLANHEEIVVKPLSPALKCIGLYSGATVLGNGEPALILDPAAIAQRAGINTDAEEDVAASLPAEDPSEVPSAEFLLVAIADRRAAVPLENVVRIEQLPATRIERIGFRPVLNFSGQLIPLDDPGNLAEEALVQPGSSLIVVVCHSGSRQVGVVVSHVLDVASGSDLFEAGSAVRTDGVTLLKEQVTGIFDLDGVPPTSSDRTNTEWGQPAEGMA